MKKLSTLKIAMFALFVFFISACSGAKESYVEVIPKDVMQLFSVDFASLSQKAELNSPDNDQYKEYLLKEIESGASESAKTLVKGILDDPAMTGVDFQAPMYAFIMGQESMSTCFVAKMADKEKFTALITELAKEQTVSPVSEAEGFSYVQSLDNQVVMAFNDETILITTQPIDGDDVDMLSFTKGLMTPKETSIYDSESFAKMNSLEGDIKFITSLESIPEIYKSQLEMNAKMTGLEVSDFSIIGSNSFDQGEINLYVTYYTEDEALRAMLEESMSLLKSMNRDILEKFPANSLAVLAAHIDGQKVWEKLNENPEFAKEVDRNKEDAETLKSLITTLDGDFAISPVYFNSLTDFTVLAYAEVTDNAAVALEAIYNDKEINRGMFNKKEGSNYAYETPFLSIYFGVKDNLLYITNNKGFQLGEDIVPSINSAYPNLDGKSTFIAVNVVDLYGVLRNMRMTRSIPSELQEPLQQINTLEVTTDVEGLVNVKVILNNKKENALKMFFDYAMTQVK